MCFKQTVQFLKCSLDNDGISVITEKDLHIIDGEKKGAPAIILPHFRVLLVKKL
jgi:hypothetical protein